MWGLGWTLRAEVMEYVINMVLACLSAVKVWYMWWSSVWGIVLASNSVYSCCNVPYCHYYLWALKLEKARGKNLDEKPSPYVFFLVLVFFYFIGFIFLGWVFFGFYYFLGSGFYILVFIILEVGGFYCFSVQQSNNPFIHFTTIIP